MRAIGEAHLILFSCTQVLYIGGNLYDLRYSQETS